MSTSTVPVAASPEANNNPSLALGTRRRTVAVAVTEKKSSNFEMVGEGGVSEGIGTDGGRDLSHTIRGETTLDRDRNLSSLQMKKGMMNSTVSPRRRKIISKPPEKPLWKTILSVLLKNFLLLIALLGLVQMIRKLALKSGEDGVVYPVDISHVEGRIAEVESFLKSTTKLMQVQMDVTNKMIESEVGLLRSELTKKFEEKGVFFENQLKKLEARTDFLDKSLGELKANGFYTKEDFERFLDEFKTSKPEGSDKDWSLDDIRAFAKELVEKEIEKHAADGLGMPDYALYSAGGSVVEHSEPYTYAKNPPWLFKPKNQNVVHPDAKRMLEPSFGEPGRCFPLKGNMGFVTIRLRDPIIPEAVTLEHVAKSVSYDRSSAPKYCRISGWLRQDATAAGQSRQDEKMFLLSEFVYDLDKSNAQTFKVESADVGIVNMIRLDFASNHGGLHTCIYRLRVHGHKPDTVAMSKLLES